VKAIPVQTLAFAAKCNYKNDLYRRHATRLGARFGHTSGHTRRVIRSVCSENRMKTREGDGFLDRRLNPRNVFVAPAAIDFTHAIDAGLTVAG
jgi:hypothetical protein